jgi:LysM repeat protein
VQEYVMSKETNMRHVWLAGLGVLSRLRESVNRIAGRVPPPPPVDEPPPFVTTHKVAKRSTHSSASRRAGERETQRRIAGKGR